MIGLANVEVASAAESLACNGTMLVPERTLPSG